MQSDRVTAEERRRFLEHLRAVHAAVIEVVGQMTPEEWVQRGSRQSWSPSEIVEHTLLVDEEVLGEVRAHLDDGTQLNWERITAGKEKMLKRYLPNSGRALASVKTSTFRGIRQEDVATALGRSYEAVSEILKTCCDAPLKAIIWPHSRMGPLSAYQWLLYVPLHAERHFNQLLRVV